MKRGARLDDMLQLVAQECLLLERTREGRQNQVQGKLAHKAVEVAAHNLPVLLALSVTRLADRETGNQVDAFPLKRRHEARCEVDAGRERAGLEQRLGALQQGR